MKYLTLLLVFLTSCSSLKKNSSIDGNWRLIFLKDIDLSKQDGGKDPVIAFYEATHRITGNFGCNTFGGAYQLTSSEIHFSNVFSTKMACPALNVENAFSANLSRVNSYQLAGNELKLYHDNVLSLTFKRSIL